MAFHALDLVAQLEDPRLEVVLLGLQLARRLEQRRPFRAIRTVAHHARHAAPAAAGFVLFGVALLVLRKELHAVTWHDLTSDVLATPLAQLLAALLLTAGVDAQAAGLRIGLQSDPDALDPATAIALLALGQHAQSEPIREAAE